MRRHPTTPRNRRGTSSTNRQDTSDDHRTAVVVRTSAVVRAVASILRLVWDVFT
jgi:hypothetical protein